MTQSNNDYKDFKNVPDHEQYKLHHERTNKDSKKTISEDGTHVVNHDLGKNLHWMHGIEEYLEHVDHKHKEKYYNLKRAIMYGNIWYIKEVIHDEIRRGEVENTDEFLNIILAHYTGYEYVNHRKVLQYVAHCIDNDYIRKMSSWSIKWQYRANLNEHFSRGQMKSKCWMVKQLNEIFPNTYLGTVAHYGGWYATVAKNLFEQFKIRKYYNLELDPDCIEISDDFNYTQYQNKWQFKSVQKNVSEIKYKDDNSFDIQIKNQQGHFVSANVKPDLIINTSCEHMNEDWFKNLPDGQLLCLQTNDYFSNEQHINCVHGIEEAKAKYPMKEVLYEGEIDTHLYNRFMLIGEK
tara:strand:+ start:4335 stop:5381 length:1047 start_codon:yes stop_codon:yes gene_type:complete